MSGAFPESGSESSGIWRTGEKADACRRSGLWRAGVLIAEVQACARRRSKGAVPAPEFIEAFFLDIFKVQKGVVRTLGGPDQFIELDLDRLRVPVLGVLDEKHDQESDDGRTGVDHQLPGVTESKKGACHQPDNDEHDGQREDPRPTTETRRCLCEADVPGCPAHVAIASHQHMTPAGPARGVAGDSAPVPGWSQSRYPRQSARYDDGVLPRLPEQFHGTEMECGGGKIPLRAVRAYCGPSPQTPDDP